MGYGLGAVGRASGEGVTGRDGWGDGKVEGGRRLGSSVWFPAWPSPGSEIIGTRVTVTTEATGLKEH